MKIEGIPDGYELVRIGQINYLDQYLGAFGDILIWNNKVQCTSCSNVILRKIERPKQYRPFANAEEFKPHRDKWWKWNPVKFPANRNYPPLVYDDNGHGGETWEQNFRDKVFDDDFPFGVEVSE
jgi:hypothetical protein